MAQGFPTLSSPAKASPLQLSPHATAPIDTKEACAEVPNQAKSCRQFMSCIGAPTSLILSPLVQELLLDDSEHTHSRRKPKEPDKALGIWSREPLLSQLKEAQSFAPSSVGSVPSIHPSPSASPRLDKAERISSIKFVSKTSKINESLDSPHLRAVPTLPKAVPAHSSQALSVQSTVKIVP